MTWEFTNMHKNGIISLYLKEEERMNTTILAKVFGWMFIGLLVTFITGYFVSMNINMLLNLFTTAGLVILLIVEVGLVIFLSARIHKMSPTTAKICFLLYSFVTGLSFSAYFVVFELNSLILVFLITAIVFAIFAVVGMTLKLDLTKLGTYLMMALLAILICMIVNIFLNNSTFDLIISTIGVLIFIGYTAYDVQKIVRMSDMNMLPEENLAIYGALDLYLDFINLFVHLLQLIGNARDN